MPLGAPISILGPTPSGHSHGEQYREYRRACHRLASMAKSLQETAGVLGALGSPVRLTCGIALSLSQALEVSPDAFAPHFLIGPHITGRDCQTSNVLGDRRFGHEALEHDSQRAGRSCKGR